MQRADLVQAFSEVLRARAQGDAGGAVRAAGPLRAAVNQELCAFSARCGDGLPGLVDVLYYAAACGPTEALVLAEGGERASKVPVSDPWSAGPVVAHVTRYAEVCGDMLPGAPEGWPSVYAAGARAEDLAAGLASAAEELRLFRPARGAAGPGI